MTADELMERARPFVDAGVLTASDLYAVALVAPRFGETSAERMLGLAFAVRAPRVGHAGVELLRVSEQVDTERAMRDEPEATERGSEPDRGAASLPWPPALAWRDATFASPLVGEPAGPLTPFVTQQTDRGALLLTRRMYREQELLAGSLLERAKLSVPAGAQIAELDQVLARLFPDEPDGEGARSVRLAARERLALVVGGPGTGKTFSITRLLAALLGARPELVISLAAPTGKAAVRMREAIREGVSLGATPPLAVPAPISEALGALEASTLHRLLGVRPDGSARHDARNPLPADVVVVDEVSMIDLTLMRRLVEAVREDARLVLLGDRDQLASVEAGSVLADLVDAPRLTSHVERFTISRRFATAPDVALIAARLQGRAASAEEERARLDVALAVFSGREHAEKERHPGARVRWLGAPEPATSSRAARPTDEQLDLLAEPYLEGFEWLAEDGRAHHLDGYAKLLRETWSRPNGRHRAAEPDFQRELLGALERYRVLSVHRRGPLGVERLERALAQRVREFLGEPPGRGAHFIGRPIIVTENAYDVELMNGDVGLVLPTLSGRVAAVFLHERAGKVRAVDLSRLPAHEGALAMTVHKSQGSQFDRVAMVLAGKRSPIETRELVYTGVTRAKNQLAWLGDLAELREALERRIERASGLGALLA